MNIKECLEMIFVACTNYDIELSETRKTKRKYEGSYEQAYDIIINELDYRIPKSEIKKLKGKVHSELDKTGITRAYQITIDKYFDELLEDNE